MQGVIAFYHRTERQGFFGKELVKIAKMRRSGSQLRLAYGLHPSCMSKLKLSIPHNLSANEALNRIRTMLTTVKEEQKDKISDLQENWEGNSGNFRFKAMGFDLAGKIDVTSSSVDIDAGLPMALSLFKGTIAGMIEQKAKKLLS